MSEANGKPKGRQVCVVMRVVTFSAGQRVSYPFGVYETKEDGEKAAERASKVLSEVARTCMLVKQRQTPDGQLIAEPVAKLTDFLADLGVTNIGHSVGMSDVQGAIMVAAPKLIVPTSH